jgi:TorA maturation chaperone TorD
VVEKSFVKTFIDPDLRKDWKKFLKKYPYLFWVQAMNVEEEKDWVKLVSQREPDLKGKPRIPEGVAEYAAISKSRRDVYYCLARSFSEPTIALVKDLRKARFLKILKAGLHLFVPQGKIQEYLEILETYSSAVVQDDEKKVLSRLRGEHLTIFYDSFFPWLSCYESVYRGEKQIMGELTAMVKDFYRYAGYRLTGEYGNDPPDDAKIEMEFMYHLCEEELQSWTAGDREAALSYLNLQKTHLQEHMIEWIPFLCDDLLTPEFRRGVEEKFHRGEDIKMKSREFDFYIAIAAITRAVLESDYNQVDVMHRVGRDVDVERVAKELQGLEPIDSSREKFALEKISR